MIINDKNDIKEVLKEKEIVKEIKKFGRTLLTVTLLYLLFLAAAIIPAAIVLFISSTFSITNGTIMNIVLTGLYLLELTALWEFLN